MSYCVKYTSDVNDDNYVFKIKDDGKNKGLGVRMVNDHLGTRFEFFKFGQRQLENIEQGIEAGTMTHIPEAEYLKTLKKFLKWCVNNINQIEKINGTD